LRRAALVVVALFLAHSLIDVPGHRMGSVLAVLAMLPLAAPARLPDSCGQGARFALAGAGLLIVLLGGLFLAQATGRIVMPGQVRREALVREIEANDRAGLHYDAINNCEEGISFAPLDWRFHFFSARSRLRINVGWSQAAEEFARARLLEPDSPLLVLHEGMLWVGRDPERAISAWSEALRRTDRKREHFRMMLDAAQRDERLMARMEALVEGHPELDFFFLHSVPDAVFDQRLSQLLSMTPEAAGFRPEDAGAFFNTWRSRRGAARFVEELAAHPAWEAAGWWWAAESLAGAGQWKEAFALADRYLVPPALPPQEADLARIRQQVRRYPDDLPAGFALAAAEGREGDWEGAARRLERLCADPQAPAYFHYELARALRKVGREPEAWKALERYVRKVQ
jgi:tetratricopeptide (TPR) repeat protein